MTEKDAINAILEACKVLNWQIAIKNTDENVDVPGMVIGTSEYLLDVLGE